MPRDAGPQITQAYCCRVGMAGAVRRLVAHTQQAPWDTAQSRAHGCKQQVRFSQFRQHLGMHSVYTCCVLARLSPY